MSNFSSYSDGKYGQCCAYSKNSKGRCQTPSRKFSNYCSAHRQLDLYKINTENDICAICYEDCNHEDHSENHNFTKLPCGHKFHYNCMIRWIESSQKMKYNCPVCRQEIPDYWMIYTRPVKNDLCLIKSLSKAKKRSVKFFSDDVIVDDKKEIQVLNVEKQLEEWAGQPMGWIINLKQHYNYHDITGQYVPFDCVYEKNKNPINLEMHARQCIMHYSEVTTWKLKKIEVCYGGDYTNSHVLWTIDEKYAINRYNITNIFYREIMFICSTWIYDVMKINIKLYNTQYLSCYNMFIQDLVYHTIIVTNPTRGILQYIIVVAMYICNKYIDDVKLELENYSCNHVRSESDEDASKLYQKYISVMEEYMLNREQYIYLK